MRVPNFSTPVTFDGRDTAYSSHSPALLGDDPASILNHPFGEQHMNHHRPEEIDHANNQTRLPDKTRVSRSSSFHGGRDMVFV